MTPLVLLVAALSAQDSRLMPACAAPSAEAFRANEEGVGKHEIRYLSAASIAYDQVLKLAPPRDPSTAERAVIHRFAPRLFTTPREFFPLKDFAVVMHPQKPWIAYHMFWEDDIDFPDDNDPSDHEVMWVQLTPQQDKLAAYFTYFHGRILQASAKAVDDANANGGRPAILVQWGKHGSMPLGWDGLQAINNIEFIRLSTQGRQSADSPLGRGWPLKFPGNWQEFIDFSRLVDPIALLDKNGMEKVSSFSNAVINRHFLRYNFAAKTEWPPSICGK